MQVSSPQPSALDRALEALGGVSATAATLGVKPPTVHQWKAGERPIPLERALAIERATNGAVTCEELRPDIDWRRPSQSEPQETKVAA